jgi:tetratricopeptide (TPR) repeat protein
MNSSAHPDLHPPRRLSRVLLVILAVLVVIAMVRVLSGWINPAPPLPVPANLEQLQPQLRAYIEEQLDWVRQHPRQMERHATLGMVYAANQLWHEARLAFENAVHLRPSEPLAHLYLAVATQETGDHDTALELYRQLTHQFPDFPQGHQRLGDATLRAGQTEEAAAAFQRLVELAPNEWRGHAGLGEVELRRGNYVQAVAHLEHAITRDAHALNARSLLGMAYRGLGRMEEAERELRLGLDSQNFPMPDPWGDTAHQHMRLIQDQIEVARSYSIAGHHERAIGRLVNALGYAPTNLTLLNNLAIALNRAGQPEQALHVIRKIHELDPHNLSASVTASIATHTLGQMDQALAWAEKAVAQAPQMTLAHVARANALLGQGRDEVAIQALQDAARCDPRDPEIQIEIGDLFLRNLDQPDNALIHYQQASRLDPTHLGARLRLARVYIERLEFDDARRETDHIRTLDPAHPGLPILEEQIYARSPPRSVSSPSPDTNP